MSNGHETKCMGRVHMVNIIGGSQAFTHSKCKGCAVPQWKGNVGLPAQQMLVQQLA